MGGGGDDQNQGKGTRDDSVLKTEGDRERMIFT